MADEELPSLAGKEIRRAFLTPISDLEEQLTIVFADGTMLIAIITQLFVGADEPL